MSVPSDDRRLHSRLAREPTLHFVLLAAALFGVHALVAGRTENVVAIDRAEIDVRVWQVEAARGRPLTEAERAAVEAAYVDEQILVREARLIGLDRDERVHDILAQKMLHVLSGDVIQPVGRELEEHYRRNLGRYTAEGSRTVTELIVPGAATPAELLVQLEEGVSQDGLSSDLPLVARPLRRVTISDLIELVGLSVAESIFRAPPDEWIGPFEAPRGDHWYRVTEEYESVPEPFAAVRDQVRWDWIAEREEALLAERVAELRNRYSIRIIDSGVQ
jgi:hypothetical protein